MQNNNQNQDPEEHHKNMVHSVVNNGGFNINRQGNEGRYTRSHHFQNTDEWDSIFGHLLGRPYLLYDTADLIHDLDFQRVLGRAIGYGSFPEVVYIPLPSREPGFRRCIFHVETANTRTRQFTGQFVPVVVTYHLNHPIARAVTHLFHVETQSHPFYQSNETLLMLTAYSNEETWIRQMCTHLVEPGDNFEAFDAMELRRPQHQHVLPDPGLVERANREVVIPDCDDDPVGFREGNARWVNIVYPQNATVQERREVYATFAAEQVNMHRYSRLRWARDNPDLPNPFELPHNIVLSHPNNNGREHLRENNPADRDVAFHNEANEYIQVLYNRQTNDERAVIAATEVRLRALRIEQDPDTPENRALQLMLALDG